MAVAGEDGFLSLFNGKDLTGWKTHSSQPGNWRVENGVLVSSGGATSHLYSERDDFHDFHLRVETRVQDGGNGGVFFRSPFGPIWPEKTPRWPMAFEAKINCTQRDRNGTGSLIAGGWVAVQVPTPRIAPGTWFILEVIAQGDRIAVKVDGHAAAETLCDAQRFLKGHLALHDLGWGPAIEFRKIEIKQLPRGTAPPVADLLLEPSNAGADGSIPMSNGTDVRGWTLAGPLTTTISVAGGVFTAANHGPSGYVDHFVTNRADFTDFQLHCEVKLGQSENPLTVILRVDPSTAVSGGMRGYAVAVPAKGTGGGGAGTTAASLALASRVRRGLFLAHSAKDALAADTWHNLEINVIGNRIRVIVNQDVVLDEVDEGRTFGRGAIALCCRPGTVSTFRNLRIRELPVKAEFAPSKDDRTRWTHHGTTGNDENWGVFQHAGGNGWVESVTVQGTGFSRYQFTEINRTDEFVELERPAESGKIFVRLHQTRAEIGPTLDALNGRYSGTWEKIAQCLLLILPKRSILPGAASPRPEDSARNSHEEYLNSAGQTVMGNPQPLQPNRQLPSTSGDLSPSSPAAQDTKRPTDSVPMVTGIFTKLPMRFGRYQVEKLLGKGAMGAVYLARDTQLERLVALKIPKLSASAKGSEKLLKRLKTEAMAAAQIDHPCVCPVHDSGDIDGIPYIAMQYVEGETLKDHLKNQAKTPQEAVQLVVQLAEGLAEAHSKKIYHRDLKPENIKLNRRGVPVIMDFGLAKLATTIHSDASRHPGSNT